jgi:signal transduction histidine kinase
MSDGNSRSTHASTADPGAVPWQSRARRLEAVCGFAALIAGETEPERIWTRLRDCLPDLLGADGAALATPLLPETRGFAAPDAAFGEAAVARAAAAAGAPGRVEVESGAGWRIPLGAECEGALLVAWSDPAAADEEARGVVERLAAQTAAALANARAYAALTEAAVRRERFFSAMSHDLRTPITAIVGYSELLADGIVGDLSGQQLEMVERISQVSGHLSQLVNDILDLAKLDAGRMEFHCESVRLGDLVDEARVAVEPQARSKGLELHTAVGDAADRTLCVDPPRVRQILVNLLSNAVKFTDHGAVAVRAGTEGRSTWIEVRDTGPGLPAGSEEAVFEEFLQLASANRSKREPSSGLGLAISRRLARAMGGELSARSAATGAAFTLTLPAENDG